jgi:putative redox protein
MTIEAHLHRHTGSLTTLGNGRHTWAADLDKALGGGDAAPDPHDLLDSALAACTALTLELYLRRKGWPVSALHVTVDRQEGKAADGRVHYRAIRRIRIDGDLPAGDRQRLLEIANRCPVHRILTGQIEIDTTLEEGVA